VQQGHIHHVRPPHRIEGAHGGTIKGHAGNPTIAGKADALVRRQQGRHLAISEFQPQAVAGQQHLFALHAWQA